VPGIDERHRVRQPGQEVTPDLGIGSQFRQLGRVSSFEHRGMFVQLRPLRVQQGQQRV
jgi:hypothetical protein